MNKWIPLTDAEQDAAWRRVEERLRFRPSIDAKLWPGIVEPKPYRTYSVAHYWDAINRDELEIDLASKAARMFRLCVQPHERMYALDWQHECMWFYPHRFIPGEQLRIPYFPDGDYYMFFAESLDWGWFGHPWEETICIFGESLLKALDENMPALFTKIVREDV